MMEKIGVIILSLIALPVLIVMALFVWFLILDDNFGQAFGVVLLFLSAIASLGAAFVSVFSKKSGSTVTRLGQEYRKALFSGDFAGAAGKYRETLSLAFSSDIVGFLNVAALLLLPIGGIIVWQSW